MSHIFLPLKYRLYTRLVMSVETHTHTRDVMCSSLSPQLIHPNV